MRKINVGKNVVYLVNDLASLTVGAFVEHMALEAKLDDIKARRAQFEQALLETIDPRELIVIDAALLELDHEVVKAKVAQLANLGADDKTRHLLCHVLVETEGLTLGELGKLGDLLAQDMGQFTDFFNALQPLSSFEFGRRRQGLLDRVVPRAQRYTVRDMRTNTVLQDTAALSIARRLDGMAEAMASNDWGALADFVAMVARPDHEEKEVEASLTGLSASDKLERYNEKLTAVLADRAEVFKQLPLGVALGVYRQYFFFRHSVTEAYAQLYQRQGDPPTAASRRYMDTFGMEATVEALHEASGYPREEVWLFSFELMHKELKRFDMKRKAEEAELKAAYEKAEREAKAKQKHK